jgi:hypothetical protein
MTTFLEFVWQRYLGPPACGVCYRCPHCDHPTPSVTINPPKAGKAIKWRCHRCGTFGDEFDVLKLFGIRDYNDRLTLVAKLRKEYESGAAPRTKTAAGTTTPTRSPGVTSSPVGAGRFNRDAALAFANLTEEERAAVLLAHKVCARERVKFMALAVCCLDHEDFLQRVAEQEAIAKAQQERLDYIRKNWLKPYPVPGPSRNGKGTDHVERRSD